MEAVLKYTDIVKNARALGFYPELRTAYKEEKKADELTARDVRWRITCWVAEGIAFGANEDGRNDTNYYNMARLGEAMRQNGYHIHAIMDTLHEAGYYPKEAN